MKFSSIVVLISVVLFSSCRHSPEVPTSPILTYSQDVSSIILNNCATSGCHDGGKGGRRRLLTYADAMQYVSAGKPFDSKLYNVITNLSFNKMPPAGNMSDDQIKVIYIWILQGAKEN